MGAGTLPAPTAISVPLQPLAGSSPLPPTTASSTRVSDSLAQLRKFGMRCNRSLCIISPSLTLKSASFGRSNKHIHPRSYGAVLPHPVPWYQKFGPPLWTAHVASGYGVVLHRGQAEDSTGVGGYREPTNSKGIGRRAVWRNSARSRVPEACRTVNVSKRSLAWCRCSVLGRARIGRSHPA
ncbi:hypothetical protein EV421DRAFT_600552 [Armillaria borealis]|uniref:Uncharacterized protein n=1 Tax=Armillaria borealis TaxID=47425 RepID=A0AA39JHT3_9AGAR|nr:hypothetical protein EV421DRAFT_600552 [Armillaria borealis]